MNYVSTEWLCLHRQDVGRAVEREGSTTIAELREGLDFRERHKFRNEEASFEDLPSATKSTNSSSHKRKSSSDHTFDTSESKRRRSNSQKNLAQKLNNGSSIGKVKPSLYYELRGHYLADEVERALKCVKW
jgi:hypothetical protein